MTKLEDAKNLYSSDDKSRWLAWQLVTWQRVLLDLMLTGDQTHLVAVELFLQLQTLLNPDLSLEIGAHEAIYSRRMRDIRPGIPTVAFEASPAVYEHFKATHDFAGRGVTYLNKAVSDEDGFVTLHLINENDGVSGRNSLLPRVANDLPASSQKVPSVRGDAVIEEYGGRDVALWIDVEGASATILRGLEKSLEAHRISSIFIEVEVSEVWKNQWKDMQVINALADKNYIPIFCDNEYGMQYNIIFVRVENMDDALLRFLLHKSRQLISQLGNSDG